MTRYSIYFLALCLLIVAAAATPARADEMCYAPEEAAADQAIRIHSELMVIGLNCQHMGLRAGQNLYGTYRDFTAKNANLFSGYEATLMSFFKKNGDPSPESSLNALRTKYANNISQDVATMRPDVFCARYAPRVVKASAMSVQDLQSWASTVYEGYPVSHPVCAGAAYTLAENQKILK